MKKMRVLSLAILALLALATPVVAQTETAQTQLVSEYPAIQTAIQNALDSQREALAKDVYRTMTVGPSMVFSGGVQTPPVALILNRLQFEGGQQLQSSLHLLPGATWFIDQARIIWLMVNVDTSQIQTASSIVSLKPGETIPVQSYTFDGSEPSGLYMYAVVILDGNQLLAQAATSFVFRSFGQYDNEVYARVDSAEKQGKFLYLKGNFSATEGPLRQSVLIGKKVFPITKSNQTNAVVDLGDESALSPGIHDITLLVWYPGNLAFDSNTLPGGLRIFLPRQPKGG